MFHTRKALFLILLLVVASTLYACSFFQSADVPDEGVWYCEELRMTLSREPDIPSTFEIAGEVTEVELCVYFDMHCFDLVVASDYTHPVFNGDCKSVDGDKMLITDLSDGNRYIFIRQPLEEKNGQGTVCVNPVEKYG